MSDFRDSQMYSFSYTDKESFKFNEIIIFNCDCLFILICYKQIQLQETIIGYIQY